MNPVSEREPLSVDTFRAALEHYERPFARADQIALAMRHLVAEGLADLPFPGGGRTWERWRALSAVAALDLSLAKLYEGHSDALAMIAELSGVTAEGLWAVWAAEAPSARVTFHGTPQNGSVSGRKSWCSGARVVDHAILSAWTEAGEPVLVQMTMGQPGIEIDTGGWNAVGMAASESVSMTLRGVGACLLGAPRDYVTRPGFWHGGAGIAAVWYGGTLAIARALASSTRLGSDPHAAAHLGAVDVALSSARTLLRDTAAWIDANPKADAAIEALRVRACVEATAHEVLLRTGRALGPGPLCGDAAHAQRCADLPVFLRQSHAERDLEALGRAVASSGSEWDL